MDMKKDFSALLSFLIVLVLLCLPGRALSQITLRGEVVDKQGDGIAFVSLGIAGTEVARLSNRNGQFEITIPKVEQKERLTFHVPGYQTVAYPIDSLSQLEILRITMAPGVRQLKTVEVVAGEKLKTRVRGNKGLVVGDFKMSFTNQRLYGVKVNVPNKTASLKSISFHVTNDSSITFTVRPFIYPVKEGKILFDQNLITENRQFTFTERKGWLQMDLGELSPEVSGTVVVGVEWLEVANESKTPSASISLVAFGSSVSFVSAYYHELEAYRGIGAFAVKAQFEFFD